MAARILVVMACIAAADARSPPPMPLPVVSPGRRGPIVNIVDLGAKGDGTSDCTSAFKKAIALLQTHSGGVLLVPRENGGRESVFTTLPLQLNVSNLTLRIETGARILARCDISAWPVEDPWPSYEGEGRQYIPFIKVCVVKGCVLGWWSGSICTVGNSGVMELGHAPITDSNRPRLH